MSRSFVRWTVGAKWLQPGKAERWVWWFAVLVLATSTIPYLIGYAVEGTEWRFTGFVFGVSDGNSYIAKMLRGATGDWLFRTPYTPYPQTGVLAFLPYLLLGKLTAPPAVHLQLVVVFHIFRFVAGIMAILATYDFLCLFIDSLALRRWGLALTILGGGLGWVLVILGRTSWQGSLPLEFYSPESFGFLALFGLPHLALARAILLWSLCILLRGAPASRVLESGPEVGAWDRCSSWVRFRDNPSDRWPAINTGLAWIALSLVQPLNVLIVWILTWGFIGLQGLRLRFYSGKNGKPAWAAWFGLSRRAIWATLISGPLVGYTVIAFSVDPFLRNWTAQNLILSPTPFHYLLAFGLLIPLVIYGIGRLARRKAWKGWFPILWVALFPFLAYAPYNLQRRLPEGVWVALVVLAMAGLEDWIRTAPNWTRWVGFGWTGLAFPSTILLFVGGITTALHVAEPIFRPVDEVLIFEMLADTGDKDQVVVGAFETGNALPAWAPMRVIIGHGPESIFLDTLSPQVEGFYNPTTSDQDRIEFLDTFAITYVFWGPAEQNLGRWNPNQAPYLQRIGVQGEYQVFQYPPSIEKRR